MHKMPPVVAKPSFDSEMEADDDEYSIENKEISSNECALCIGLYEDDYLSLENWVECRCKKWMHRQCLQDDNDLYVCVGCAVIDLAN